MDRDDCLFFKIRWADFAQRKREQLEAEIDGWEGNQLLNTSVDDLCRYFGEKYRINIPVLDREKTSLVPPRETQIDVSSDSYHAVTILEFTVPFTGDVEAFSIRPTTFSLDSLLPCVTVGVQMLTILITGTNLEAREVRRRINHILDSIDSALTTLRGDAKRLNRQLKSMARLRIEQRRNKLLANQNLAVSLGFPLTQRNDSPKTYTAPEVRRKIILTPPQASSMPYTPEPALDKENYEHILEVIENMAQVMERSPSAFSTMDEESLRSHFLVQLNGHYEGQATGETFNYEGKTDILIRSEGRNIFIAECKYWVGPQKLTEAIDQLLGYSSWRDTKVAVIVFNRNKGFTRVLEAIKSAAKTHPNFKRELDDRSETSFRFIFSHRDDTNRELTLTIMAFDIPQ